MFREKLAPIRTKLPIAAIFTSLQWDIPYTKLQQLNAVGFQKVYVLLSDDELNSAFNIKRAIYCGGRAKTLFEYYQGFLPDEQVRIEFVYFNTGKHVSEEAKLRYFLETVEDVNLINICFYSSPNMPWAGGELISEPGGLPTTTITITVIPFGIKIFEHSYMELPVLNQRRSPACMDVLLQREVNPVICIQDNGFDIMYHQALFNVFVELITLKLARDEGDIATTARSQMDYYIHKYEDIVNELKQAEIAFEESSKAIYSAEVREPEKLEAQMHALAVERQSNAEKAFPELIANIVKVYRSLTENRKPVFVRQPGK